MKISLYTITLNGGYYGGPAVPLLEIFPKAKAWGYDGIEIEAKRPHGSPLDLDTATRRAIRQAADDNGLELSCIASYNDFSSPIDEHRENELLMVREQIKLAADVGAPLVRVFSAWSGVSYRDGAITYEIARHNLGRRYPGFTTLEQWNHVRDCLGEAAKMAEDADVILALQNHTPVIENYQHMLDFIGEVDSPALKACLDAPLLKVHTEDYYREAIEATGEHMVHTHFGGRFERMADGTIRQLQPKPSGPMTDYYTFMKLAKEIVGFDGHTGYELCSPVLIDHRHAGLEYALEQAQLACEFMRRIIDAV
jgi:sugar phosphate isomerase/epimerase